MNRLARVLAGVVGLTAIFLGAPAHAGNGYLTSRDLTDAGAPAAVGSTVGWVTPWDNVRHLAYKDGTANVVAGSASDVSNWSWVTATAQAGLPSDPNVAEPWAPASALMAYAYAWDFSSHIVYTGNDGHIHELWSTRSSPTWKIADLTAAAGGPTVPVWENPTAYSAGGAQHVIYQSSVDNTVWEMVYTVSGGWSTHNLSAATGTWASTTGGASPGSAVAGSEQVVAYLNRDTTIHLMIGDGTTWRDLTTSAISTPADFAQTLNVLAIMRNGVLQRLAVEYVAPHGRLHELAQNTDGTWSDTDLTSLTGAAVSWYLGAHAAGVQPADGSEHIFAENGAPGTLFEYVRTLNGNWYHWTDVSAGTGEPAVFFAPEGTAAGTEYVAYPGLAGGPLDQHLTLLDVTVPNQ